MGLGAWGKGKKLVFRKFLPLPPIVPILALLLMWGCAGAPEVRRTGTQRAYNIGGRWYKPLDSAEGFESSGVASWYGGRFHGKKTANGETYDMNGMTAAHKTLPMGTYVRVIREDSNREVIVRINDRGPFVADRIIDLSYKAARELDMIRYGTAEVRVVALGVPEGGQLVPSDYSHGDFEIQAGSFRVKENAEKLKKRLKNDFKNTYITEFKTENDIFYRVRIGGFTSLEKANKALDSLPSLDTAPFVISILESPF